MIKGFAGLLKINRAYIKGGVSLDGWSNTLRNGASSDHWVRIGSESHEQYRAFNITLFWFFITVGWAKK